MKRLKRIQQLTNFDPEPFIGSILRCGMLLSITLITVACVWQWRISGGQEFNGALEGTNILAFLLADFRNMTSTQARPRALLHVGIALLLMLPWIRIFATSWYFTRVERNGRYAWLTAAIGLILSYILFLG